MINVEKIISSGENSRLEVKKAASGLPHSLWESYSAFANTEGGVILLGITEINSILTITGAAEASKKVKNLWDQLNDRQKISVNILSERHIYIQQIHGKEVIVIEVPRADRHDKPVFINNDLFDGTYRRNSEGDYHCTNEEIKSMLRDQSDIPMDSAIVPELTRQDLDADSISRYRNRFASLKPVHVWNELDIDDFLQKTGAIKKSEPGIFKPTFAGLLMFGTEDVITRILPDYFLDYREKYDEARWSDRVASNLGEWSGNIFDFFFKIVSKLTSDIKMPFRLRNAVERMDDTFIHVALREALANALIHADYRGKRGIVVEKNKQTIIISNPGILRPTIEEAMDGGVSDPRNPTIFKLFALIDIGERAGSGLFNIRTIWENLGWQTPDLREQLSPEQTILTLQIEISESSDKLDESSDKLDKSSDKSDESSDKLDKSSDKLDKSSDKSDESSDKSLLEKQELQTTILNYMKHQGSVRNSDIANATGLSSSRVRQIFSEMVKNKIIESHGANKNRYYTILK